MSKALKEKISLAPKKETEKRIFSCLANLDSSAKVEAFLDDLLFESEMVMIVRRVQIAQMLMQGKQYVDIKQELGVGDSTIADVRSRLEGGRGALEKFVASL